MCVRVCACAEKVQHCPGSRLAKRMGGREEMGWPNCVNTYAPPSLFLYFITHVCVPCTALGLLGLLELHLRHCGLARLHDLPGAPPSWEGKGEPALPISLSLSRARALFLSHACCPRAQQPPLSGTQASPPRRRRSLPACPTCCSRAACPHFNALALVNSLLQSFEGIPPPWEGAENHFPNTSFCSSFVGAFGDR